MIATNRQTCYQTRLDGLRGYLHRSGLDAVVVTDRPNIRYLSGFTGSDGVAVISPDGAWFLTDSRYISQAGEQATDFTVIEYRRKFEESATFLTAQGFRRCGCEDTSLTVAQHAALKEHLSGVELVPVGGEIARFRSVKDFAEIDMLRSVASLVSRSFLTFLAEVRPGIRERDLALKLEWAMRSAGVDDKSFDFIVASGLRGALPHGAASEKLIEAGELVTFDFGGVMNGYCSDETVTVMVGAPDQQQRDVYRIVKEAHIRAIDAVKPGAACREIDAVARDHIAAAGYGEFFGHGLGHGVGLDVHEKPTLSPRSDETLAEGMVVTVEPGIYIPGWGGVRIEDTVVVTRDGCECLTQVPKELRVL